MTLPNFVKADRNHQEVIYPNPSIWNIHFDFYLEKPDNTQMILFDSIGNNNIDFSTEKLSNGFFSKSPKQGFFLHL